MELKSDETVVYEHINGTIEGTWKLTSAGLLELTPYPLESKAAHPAKQEVTFEVSDKELTIKGGGPPGGSLFLRG